MGITPAKFREIALSFPGATESQSYGRAAFRVGKRFFTWIRPEERSFALAVGSLDERDMMLDSDPALFHITEHYRNSSALLVRLERATPALTRKLFERRYRAIATKTLLAELDGRDA